MAMSLALVSSSVLAGPVQWNSVDSLVNASESIKTTLNVGIRRIGGAGDVAAVGGIAQDDGFLQPVYMSEAQKNAYNVAVGDVTTDIFNKTATEYLAEQSVLAQENFSAAVDAFILAASPFIQATYVNALAAQVQTSGDAIQGQQLQSYLQNNNVLITSQHVTDYNSSLDTVELAAEVWGTVEAVYQDPNRVAALQAGADASNLDFLNADDLFLDRFSEFNESAAIVFTSGVNAGTIMFVDVASNLMTTAEIIDVGAVSDFYTTGPTQDENVLCEFTNGWQSNDSTMPCYVAPPAP